MSETDRLRGAIDAGRTRDKVPFSDPAAAPLGTDDEAAGHPAGAERRAMAAGPVGGSTAGGGTDERGRAYDDKGTTVPGVSFVTAIVGLLVLVIGAGALVAALLR
ncbi:hypothetical protein [Ancylobacter vacuolatus]|uniref:Uncharacterized protein n=1 Tax=Ancylobacter vacuolatus TaxID=223389 RepID=A0ABU0DGH6_9HYPH|nr:hypothetical protein [Ancylobacter vacuolatus]MDQ0347484.1 hypothetical protein [Ancylobacter vacuolatus]